MITLTENVTLSGQVTIAQNTTVDLAGYTLTGAATVFDVTAGTLTIRDSSEGKTGTITTFGPTDPVLREQLAAILFRYAEYKGTRGEDFAVDMSKYTDFSDVSDWAVDAVTWCVGAGIINGMTETTIVPQGTGTRAQMATMLMRYSN